MIRLFVGYDQREEVGSHVFTSSLLEHCSQPVAVTHLHKPVLEAEFGRNFAEGSNAFTVSRFLVPALCDFKGRAIFVDGADMLMNGDLADLLDSADTLKPISVVKHNYKTRFPRKYLGTAMESENRDYERKQWASVMVFNCWHQVWKRLTPDVVGRMPIIDLLQLKFLPDADIASIPVKWNWLADEFGENENAKLLHFTAGVPGFPKHADSAHAQDWFRQLKRVNYATE